MKISFWTLGMPPWTNQETAIQASRLGYDGVDLRCTRPENGQPSDLGNLCVETPAEALDQIRQTYERAGVSISCMLCYNSGGHYGSGATDWDALAEELSAHAQVAARIGASMVRFTVGRPGPGVSWEDYLDELAQVSLAAVKPWPGLSAVYENHVGSASAEQLFKLAERVGDERIGVVFSPDHCMVMQEDSLALAERYTPYIKQVSFSDRRPVQEDLGRFDGRYYYVRYETCWNGEGTVPASRIFATLADCGYGGYVALKWEKSARFGHELPPGDQALEHFIPFMESVGVRRKD